MKKRKFFYYNTIMIISLLLLLSGCDSWPTDLEANIDQESKDYCLFAEDSYWVYQDTATLETDSLLILNVSYYKSRNANPKVSFKYEEYDMKTIGISKYHNIHSYSLYQLTSMYCDDSKVEAGINKFIHSLYRNEIDKIYLEHVNNYSNYHNGDLYESAISKNGKSYYETFYENYQIEGHPFSKVKVFSSPFESSTIRTFWAKNVGIIRTEYIGEDSCVFAVRNLIRYNVKPYKQ